jgi:quinol monooxygenase YgiN
VLNPTFVLLKPHLRQAQKRWVPCAGQNGVSLCLAAQTDTQTKFYDFSLIKLNPSEKIYNSRKMKTTLTHLTILLALPFAVLSQQFDTNKKMETTVVRISLGYFAPEQSDKVESMLSNEFKASLIPAIKKLKGNISYYVGIDKEKYALTNVSVWESKEDAMQMATLKEMLDFRTKFEALGIKFIEITNHQVLWELK